jgi:pyruvyltransferase
MRINKIYNIIKSPNRYKYIIKKYSSLGLSILLQNGIKAYWWNYLRNAGDLVTPALLRHYGFTPIHTQKENAEIISCGSVLQNLPQNYHGYIIGSGLLNSTGSVPLRNAKILALRGELTRDCIRAPKNTILGDPGLLITNIYKKKQVKKFELGIVPHYSDKEKSNVKLICQEYPNKVHFIDIQKKLKHVLEEIDKCEYILSSSLHGIVFADSLDIPCGWFFIGKDLPKSKQFKFKDYNSALQREQKPFCLIGTEKLSELLEQTNKPNSEILHKTKENLDKAFLKLKKHFLS